MEARAYLQERLERERDQPVRLRIGERLEENVVNDAEDRGIGADAEGEGERGDEREARRPRQAAEGEAEVHRGSGLGCRGARNA